MTDYVRDTFARIERIYNDLEDFGPGPLFAVISELILQGRPDVAAAVCMESAYIHGADDHFIIEGETTNNEVFLEVFRRVFFTSADTVPAEENRLWRSTAATIATFLADFAIRLEAGMNQVGAQPITEAANDPQA